MTISHFPALYFDEQPFTFKKMHKFSIVDGFVEITESSAEMIKSLANEPSVGLSFIQQHTQNAVPNLIKLKNSVGNKSRELTFHTQDMEESIAMVKSMKEGGSLIIDDMISNIKKSLSFMSSKQPEGANRSGSGFHLRKISSWGPDMYAQEDHEKSYNYLSSVFKSAKSRASNFKWAESEDGVPLKDEKALSHFDSVEGEEGGSVDGLSNQQLLPLLENFDEFRAVKEAKLEEWLAEKD